MDIIKIFLITAMISGCAHTLSEVESGAELAGIPEFESLVGSGMLETTGAGVTTEHTKAWVSFNDNYTVVGKERCEALILTSTERPILAVAKCDEDNDYYICGRAPEECHTYYETKKSSMHANIEL